MAENVGREFAYLSPRVFGVERNRLGLSRPCLQIKLSIPEASRMSFDVGHQLRRDAVTTKIGSNPQSFHFGEM